MNSFAKTPQLSPIPVDVFEPFVSAEVVAAHLGIQRREVLEMSRAGKLPAHVVDPTAKRKTWRYKLSEVDAMISGNMKLNQTVRIAETAVEFHNIVGSPRSRRG